MKLRDDVFVARSRGGQIVQREIRDLRRRVDLEMSARARGHVRDDEYPERATGMSIAS